MDGNTLILFYELRLMQSWMGFSLLVRMYRKKPVFNFNLLIYCIVVFILPTADVNSQG